MRVLMIAPQPFFEPRGTPISIYQRLSGLSKLGYSVDLATYHLGRDVDFPGVRIWRTPRIPFIQTIKVGPSWQKIPLDFLLFGKSVMLLLRNRYDAIHSHEEAGFFSVWLAKIFRTKHLYDMHSSLPKQLTNFKFGDNQVMIGIFEALERSVINSCDAMITIGPDLEAQVQQINPKVPEKMIENLPLFETDKDPEIVRMARIKSGLEDKIIIVYTGTFERYQGVDLLIESFARLKDRFPQSALILVGGKAAQIEELELQAASCGVREKVKFTGTLPVEEANQYIEMADILVSPRIEGTSVPLKIYTYLRAGKPILATNLGAHTLVLDSNTAILVEPTLDGFVEGLEKLIADEGLRKSLGENGRRLAEEKYNEASYLAKLSDIYQALWPSSPTVGKKISTIEGS
jgi:glycosyltransferase involved in cell wall biosynthesis